MCVTRPTLRLLGCFGAVIFALATAVWSARAGQHATLQPDDCGKCHAYEASSVRSKGGKHKTAVTCLDCHREHLPAGSDTIAPCSRCHSGTPHFQLENAKCLQCHTKAHMPITSITFPLTAKEGCITCHAKQGREVTEFKSKHAEHSCVFCHDTHQSKPVCQECHVPHSDDPEMAECRHCHPTHHPLQIEPIGHTPVKLCAPCHVQIARELRQTATRHGTLSCTYCHSGGHPPPIPKCRDCHGWPHGKKLHRKTPSCNECHNGPHRLIG